MQWTPNILISWRQSMQRASVRHIYDGRNTFVWLPIGLGKFLYATNSFPYTIGSMPEMHSLVVVVSPL